MLRVKCKSRFAIVFCIPIYILESEMCECAVCLCHAVHVFFTLVSAALVVKGVHNLGSQFVGHGLAATFAGVRNHVLHRDTFLALCTYFGRNLERGTTNTAALHLHLRSDVVQGRLPDFEGRLLFLLHLCLYGIKGVVENFVRGILLTIVHQVINELRDLLVVVHGIGKDHAFLWFCFSHFCFEKNYSAWGCHLFFNFRTRMFTQPFRRVTKLIKTRLKQFTSKTVYTFLVPLSSAPRRFCSLVFF